MPKFFVKNTQIEEEKNRILIIGSDVNHIKNVLRAKIGDELIIAQTPNPQDYKCQIVEFEKDKIICKILEKLKIEEEKVEVTIFQGLPKADKMELIIQKSVELGAMEIVPVQMKRCVVKLDKKDKIKKIQRWQKISEVAAKQCGRNEIPEIKPCIYVKDVCQMIQDYDVVLVAYEKESENKIKNELKKLKEVKDKQKIKIGVVIGPEGGLEPEDVEMLKQSGAKIVTLGKRILRTETVALNVTSNIMYELED